MCLVTKQKEPIILTEDLLTYKYMNFNRASDALRPMYIGCEHTYKLHTLHKVKMMPLPFISSFFDTEVVDKYLPERTDNQSEVWTEMMDDKGLIGIGPGFHSALRSRSMFWMSESTKVYCKIPKGSEVFFDETGLVVSNQIIYSLEN